jgi:hypothetical protein
MIVVDEEDLDLLVLVVVMVVVVVDSRLLTVVGSISLSGICCRRELRGQGAAGSWILAAVGEVVQVDLWCWSFSLGVGSS